MSINLGGQLAAKITPRQAALFVALGHRCKLSGDKLLDFIEFDCGVKVTTVGDVPAAKFTAVKKALEERILDTL